MRGQVTKLGSADLDTLSQLAGRMQTIQDDITLIEIEERLAMEAISAIRERKVAYKKRLVPLANMRAGIASPQSRKTYFNITADEMRIHTNAYLRDTRHATHT